MESMRTVMIWIILSAPASWAQTPVILDPFGFPPQLKQYLALTDDQVARIGAVRTQFATLQAGKVQRQFQLQQEIAEQTARAVPDPLALGIRYAELESIRRELETRQKSLVSQTQLVLGADQKIKLVALEQALALNSTACSAIGQNLLSPPVASAQWFDSSSFGSVLVGIPSLGTCAGIPTAIIRTGDFSQIVQQP